MIISIDGLRPDAWEAANTPGLDGLRRQGAYSAAVQAVLPSVTLVNHASMLGGMVPDKHGINWNNADDSKGKINGPTLFSVAHEAGFSTAMVVGKPKLNHLNLPGSVDTFIYAGYIDQQITAETLQLIAGGPPDILFVHLPDIDSAGHLTGWMSSAQLSTLELTDGLITDIVRALDEGGYLANTLLIITADHGGSGFSHGSESAEDTTVPWLAVGPGISAGRSLATNISMVDTAATALYALNLPIPPEWDGQPVLEIFE
jgi:predicted AlkP superfamily pyrophosphatase or phosphodiesterase